MKLLLLSLLTVHCCVLVNCTIGKHRLEEILKYINVVKSKLTNGERLINTPPQDTESYCCLTALDCFRSNLYENFNASEVTNKKLIRSLKSQVTVNTMNFCNSNNTMSTCQEPCHMHPKKSAKEFLQRLESLIQMANTQLAIAKNFSA